MILQSHTVAPNGEIHAVFDDDGTTVRKVYRPGQDMTGADATLRAAAAVAWTPEVVLAYQGPAPTPEQVAERLAARKAREIAKAEEEYDATMFLLTEQVPPAERDTWPYKEAAVAAYDAGTASTEQLAMLNAEIAYTGETLVELTDKIRGKAAAWYAMVGAIRGMYRKAYHAIRDAADDAGIDTALATLATDRATYLAALP